MKTLKRIGIGLGILILILVIVVIVLHWRMGNRLETTYAVTPIMAPVPSDSAGLARGKHWADVLCSDCHGLDFSGKRFFEDPGLGHIDTPNLTSGKGGIGATYSDADWFRSIRHGIRPNGRPLFVMPSYEFNHMSSEDIGALVAYLKTVPPVDHVIGGYELTFKAKVLAALGAFGDVLTAETIDHRQSPITPPAGQTVPYGKYLVDVAGCRTCHGKELAGGKDPNPAAPPGPNLTTGGLLGSWNEDQFIRTIRSGITPEGRPLQAVFMPWPFIGKMTDDELKAIFLYLKSLPKQKSAV